MSMGDSAMKYRNIPGFPGYGLTPDDKVLSLAKTVENSFNGSNRHHPTRILKRITSQKREPVYRLRRNNGYKDIPLRKIKELVAGDE